MTFASSHLNQAVAKYRSLIDDSLDDYAQEFLESVTFPLTVDPRSPYFDALEGGKRFRALCSAVGAICALQGQDNPETLEGQDTPDKLRGRDHGSAAQALDALSEDRCLTALGCALEFYQASALVHDDLLDNSPTRRGRPAVHAFFESLHRTQSLLGDAKSFGRDGAVLVGNLLTSAAEYALSAALEGVPGPAALVRAYSKMTGEVAMGQLADTTAAYLPLSLADPKQVDATLDIVRYKSARYSIMNPAKLGALAKGAPREVLEALGRILEPAGIAFQLRDDALGVFGEDQQTGKPTGIDILEGKRTVLLALTLTSAPPEVSGRIVEIYQQGTRSEAEAQYVIDAMGTYGSPRHEALIVRFQEEAYGALAESGFTGPAKELLEDLVHRVTTRAA